MNFRLHRKACRQQGYILLVLLLFVALISIGFLAAIRRIDFEIRRDREQELIHRGVQYSRAVRRYFKKFGRYPTRIEELESSNNIRFLRKRYKDPITGADFKLLHLTDVQLGFGLGPAAVNGINAQSVTAAALATGAPAGLNGVRGGGQGGFSLGATPGSQNVQLGDQSQAGQAVSSTPAQGDGSQQTPVSAGRADTTVPPPQPLVSQTGPGSGPQVFGGGAIVGVSSTSKDKTIREFNKKNHYNQWQFIYDPSSDRGGLLMTPNQPPLLGAVQASQQQPQQQPGAQPGFPAQNQGFGVNSPAQPQSPQSPAPQTPNPLTPGQY
jgi:type II secretory pathway pseudopilin PulG